MMKSLVIAEKPSVGRDIARVLKCNQKSPTSIEGSKYVVTWGLGHLVSLAPPEKYDMKYKEWKMEDLPIIPKKMKFEVLKQTSKQYGAVKRLIHRKDIHEIIIATDAGREGELVARLILEEARNVKPMKRLWISSVTDKAITEGFKKLKPSKEYDNLYMAALSRAEADWLVGMNASRALTCKFNAQLSCGRVQTPTLAMIAAREKEIKDFIPKPYFGLTALGRGILFTWQEERSKSVRSFDKQKVDRIFSELSKKPLIIKNIEKQKKKSYAPALYNLTELQRDANKRFQYSAKETLDIMQRLYEHHKVLTYPRTDSRYLSDDVIPTLQERLKACAVGPYKKIASRLSIQTIKGKPAFVNNAKVSDHHAIIPTEEFVQLDKMSKEERRIYDLVIKRFLSVLLPPFEYEQTILTATIGKEIFTARGKVVIKQGFKEVYDGMDEGSDDEEEVKDQSLPNMEKGEEILSILLKQTSGKTTPPKPFNEATLLSAMENPTQYMTTHDKNAAKTLHETGGLGTVATRADIIEKLFSSFLLEKKGKDIYTTGKARQLLELVPEDLKKPELTAHWETNLSRIANGNLDRNTFMTDIQSYSMDLIKEIKTSTGIFKHDNLTNKICPDCGKKLLEVKGKNSRMLVCQDRECGYRQTISRTSNARCPVCHKRMEIIGSGEASTFICSCGHKEKMDKFQERRKKEGKDVTKKDVANYMKKQKKEAAEPINNAFASALANIKLDKDE
ncbi:MAG TPA: DNA topoisomerase III [Candidatus Merdenecus merdavium]|nr:DNA topoisomerase III [Candidatus Merdenecus merdavium]